MHADMDSATRVKMLIYGTLAETGAAPTRDTVARDLGLDAAEVAQAFTLLNQSRLLVPEPGDPSRIRMAPPFSGVPTPHIVHSGGRRYFANCAWDTFGIAAALHQDADIESKCMDCGEELRLQVKDQRPRADAVLFHIAVPAAKWWDDIVFT
jgi:alkylmercury lyase-like protein